MGRKNPYDAAIWQGFLEIGEVRCRGCNSYVNLDEAEDITEAIEIWNQHVKDEHSGNMIQYYTDE